MQTYKCAFTLWMQMHASQPLLNIISISVNWKLKASKIIRRFDVKREEEISLQNWISWQITASQRRGRTDQSREIERGSSHQGQKREAASERSSPEHKMTRQITNWARRFTLWWFSDLPISSWVAASSKKHRRNLEASGVSTAISLPTPLSSLLWRREVGN